MKKWITSFLLVILLSIFLVPSANAAQTTGYRNNPSMQLLIPVKTPVYSLTTSKDTIRGENCFVYFANRTNLPSVFAYSNNRILEATLYEADEAPNADDVVKVYTYKFKGRKMDGVSWTNPDPGNIDSSGDKTGELYLQFFLTAVPEDTDYSAYTGTFFQYKITVE